MRIRAFLGAALLAMCSLALMPAAMAAEPAPDACVFDMLSIGDDAAVLDTAVPVADLTCVAVGAVAALPDTPDGDDDEGVDACLVNRHSVAVSAYRLHVDPGRCSA